MRDHDVRAAVLDMLDIRYSGDAATRIVEEMGVWSGSARVDIAVINGELCGYELKSDRDTLARLPSQVELYGRVFDRMVLVAGNRHVKKVAAMVPDWWGIVAATDSARGVELSHVRDGKLNPSPNPYLVAQLLWREEAVSALESLGAAKGWRSKPASAIHERLASILPLPELSALVREALKRRRNWLGQAIGDKRQVTVYADLDPCCPAA